MYIHEVIVVEGRSDTVAIGRAVEADTIETNGSAVGESVLKQIELAHKRRGVIILTDPDYPGDRIRRIVAGRVPGCKHAFLPKKEAVRAGRNIGVEHASPEAIRRALQEVKKECSAHRPSVEETITLADLHAAGLASGEHARWRREKLGEYLSIGYANSKQLLKRLHVFRVSKEEFKEALRDVYEKEECLR
ncbi:ribonuclease M5 [Shouchella shacheensis]|uniref:ribonuclease M5 n=1 Tax=Shouchella shacheensis TaxID=1649580 RepID=UPI0007401E67|nr:ribonuclease M5 [Shouchella shacheensis]